MRNTKLEILMFLVALVPGIATSVVAQDTTYVWQSADGDPFNIQGTIVLDSPSSANGSASDVVSLSITDTVDSYSWTPATGGGAGELFLGTVFAWNPNQILNMDLSTPGPKPEYADAYFIAHPGYGAIFDFSVLQPPSGEVCDQSGEWVAASTVPEPSALQLLLFGVLIFIAVRWFAAPASQQRSSIVTRGDDHFSDI
jgi:hypothetical protein